MRHLQASRLSGTRKVLALGASLAATTALTSQAYAQAFPQYAAHTAVISSTVHAFNASLYQRVPLNLATLPTPYTETEYSLSGLANVYQYVNPSSTTDESIKLLQATPLSYVNRILVRAPTNPAKFSGNVIVEIANDALTSDNQVEWPYANSYFTSNGDAYILLTSTPLGLLTLKGYSATRYRGLSWPLAAATRSCSGGAQGEGGVIYDQITELGNLLKSGGSTSPLAGYNVKSLFLTGYSAAAEILLSYDLVFGQTSPLYSGYMVSAGGFRAALNGCEASSSATGRAIPPSSTVSPVFQTQTISELVVGTADNYTLPTGTDSNTATNRYRLYEVAGSTHVNGDLIRFSPQRSDFPSTAYLTDVTQSQLTSECAQPTGSAVSSFPNRYVYDALWSNLEKWAAQGTSFTPPSEAAPYNVDAYLVALEFKQAPPQEGGVRSPAVDVPDYNYYSGTVVSAAALTTFCALTGYQTTATTTATAAAIAADAVTLAADGFLTSADAATLENTTINTTQAYSYPDGTTSVPDNPPTP